MTMFPETITEGEEVPSTQMMPGQPTNLQRLAQPAQILKAAVSSLATYQVSSLWEWGVSTLFDEPLVAAHRVPPS